MVLSDEAKKKEEQYFFERERQLLEEMRKKREARIAEAQAREAEEERKRLRDLHYMRCPKCGHSMEEKDLEGIKVDVCSLCEGIYFDRGELEQLLVGKQSEVRRGFFRSLFGLGKA